MYEDAHLFFRLTCRFGVKRHVYLYEDDHLLKKMRIFIQINMPFYTLKNPPQESGDSQESAWKPFSPGRWTGGFAHFQFMPLTDTADRPSRDRHGRVQLDLWH